MQCQITLEHDFWLLFPDFHRAVLIAVVQTVLGSESCNYCRYKWRITRGVYSSVTEPAGHDVSYLKSIKLPQDWEKCSYISQVCKYMIIQQMHSCFKMLIMLIYWIFRDELWENRFFKCSRVLANEDTPTAYCISYNRAKHLHLISIIFPLLPHSFSILISNEKYFFGVLRNKPPDSQTVGRVAQHV